MKNLKSIESHIVYRYVDTLSTEDLKSCALFLSSKWNYKKLKGNYSIRHTKALFKCLAKKKQKYQKYLELNKGLTVEPLVIFEYQVFNSVFGKKYDKENISFADQRLLNNHKTVLNKMLQQYLVINLILNEHKEGDFLNLLMETLYFRLVGKKLELEYLGDRNFKIFEKKYKKAPSTTESVRYKKMHITNQNYYEIAINNKGIHSQSLLKVLKEEFLINVIQTLCTTISRAYLFNVPREDLSEYVYLQELVNQSTSSYEIQMYYKIFNLLNNTNEDDNFYFDCFKYFVNHDFSLNDTRQIFGFLFMYLNEQILLGRSILISARILLIKYIIEKEGIPAHSALFSRLFISIIRYALQERINSGWITNFIFEMQDALENALPEKEKNTLDRIADAHSFFAEKDYLNANGSLSQANLKNTNTNRSYAGQILQIKIDYEISEGFGSQRFKSKLESLKNNDQRDGPADTFLNANINFCKVVKKLHNQKNKIHDGFNIRALTNIYKEIVKSPIEERTWLIEKLNKLISKKNSKKSKQNHTCPFKSCKSINKK